MWLHLVIRDLQLSNILRLSKSVSTFSVPQGLFRTILCALCNNAGNLYDLVTFHCAADNMYLGFKGQSVRPDPVMTLTLQNAIILRWQQNVLFQCQYNIQKNRQTFL